MHCPIPVGYLTPPLSFPTPCLSRGGGGVGDRHLVTIPQGVVGDRLPWGGEGRGGGGYLTPSGVLTTTCWSLNRRLPLVDWARSPCIATPASPLHKGAEGQEKGSQAGSPLPVRESGSGIERRHQRPVHPPDPHHTGLRIGRITRSHVALDITPAARVPSPYPQTPRPWPGGRYI